jgi:hypothetical protein
MLLFKRLTVKGLWRQHSRHRARQWGILVAPAFDELSTCNTNPIHAVPPSTLHVSQKSPACHPVMQQTLEYEHNGQRTCRYDPSKCPLSLVHQIKGLKCFDGFGKCQGMPNHLTDYVPYPHCLPRGPLPLATGARLLACLTTLQSWSCYESPLFCFLGSYLGLSIEEIQ